MRDQSQLARGGDRGAIAQNGEVLLLDRVQNFQTAAAEQIKVDREFAIDSSDQGPALPEPVAGALHLELHHLAKSGSVLPAGDIVLGDAKAAQVFERQVNPVLLVIDTDVLPEIGELQRGAGEVGKLLALSVPVPAKIQDEMPD